MAIVNGWGRGTWGEGAWNEEIPVTVTGVAGTGAVGSVTVSAGADAEVTGLEATASEGSVTVSGAFVITENSGWLHALRLNVLQFFPVVNAVQDRDCRPRCLPLASHSRAHGL